MTPYPRLSLQQPARWEGIASGAATSRCRAAACRQVRSLCSRTLAQMIAHRRASVSGATQSAALQVGYDQIDEVAKRPRKICRQDYEPVGQPPDKPLAQGVCYTLRRAVDHPMPTRRRRDVVKIAQRHLL